jgi:hemerythrin
MRGFRWEARFAVGDPIVDAQHRLLFELANRLHEAVTRGDPRDGLVELLAELATYAKAHFAAEEAAATLSDPHREEHQLFVARLSALAEETNLDRPLVWLDVLNWLENWLLDHVLATDVAGFAGRLRTGAQA